MATTDVRVSEDVTRYRVIGNFAPLAVFKEQGLFSVLVEGRGGPNSVFALKSLLDVAEGSEAFK